MGRQGQGNKEELNSHLLEWVVSGKITKKDSNIDMLFRYGGK